MPWHVEQGAAGCAGWAVIKDADGSLAGCHPSQADAMAQVAALYAQEPMMAPAAPGTGTPCPPGHHMMPDGSCMSDMDMVAALTGGTPVHGILAVEGQPTGDSPPRQFAPGSLEWAPPPLALKWQPAEDEGHEGAVIAGRIDEIWRDGPLINFRGVMDDAGVNGAEALRLIQNRMLRGVSIMADDVAEEDVEYVYPPPAAPMMPPMPPDAMPPDGTAPAMDMMPDMPMHDMMDMMPEAEPIMEIYHHGRIRSATLLPEPAFVEATVELGEPVVTAAAVAPHGGATSDGPWDGPANEKQLPSPMPVATARGFYAWIDDAQITDEQIPKVGGKFGHHEVTGGTPGAANVKACQTGIGVLNGGRGGTTIPNADVQGVYNHFARHLRDAGLEAPPLTAAGFTAAAYTITIPEIWPESWFEEPTQAPPVGALHITPEGRVFGYLGPDQVAHRAFRASGRKVTIPRGVDYTEFQNKPCLVAGADGQVYRINAGNITFDCGHPSPYDERRQDPTWAMQHYDNTCSIAARIRVGENRYGTWVAGGLLHGITPDAVERMMACALSGDWQGGRLNAALLVPVEGFPMAQTSSVRVRDDALVASTVPVRYVGARPGTNFRPALERLARSAGRDATARFAALRNRVKDGR